MSIRALDSKTVQFLTTSQVISSVATAVKELVENGIDAGATGVEIKLVDDGHSLIEVSDDGSGIAPSDMPFAALRSHTSRITDFGDLDSLESYGFRGEALHSLCGLADVTIVTKTKEDTAARSYDMDHEGRVRNVELCHRRVGTTVKVKSLFKDLPVRRQIITGCKRSNKDVGDLARAFAICQPKIRISLRINGAEVLTRTSCQTVRESLSCLFGNKFTSRMEFVEKTSSQLSMTLVIPKKDAVDLGEISHVGQRIFVNNRPIVYKELEKIINKRLSEHFEDKAGSRKKISFILIIQVPASDVDVNLEPDKSKVFLTNQKLITETLDETLIKFYGPNDGAQEASNGKPETSEEPAETPACKKRKILNSAENTTTEIGDAEIPETLSQLPVVDLGEDFSEWEILNIPKSDPAWRERFLEKENRVDVSSNVENSSDPKKFTAEAWSKGRVPTNIRGGTNVEIYGNAIEDEESDTRESAKPDIASTGCPGFLKFSREFRPQIIAENPGINFVEVAKELTTRWKDLSPEERGYYRDVAAADAPRSIAIDASQNSSRSRKRLDSVTCEAAEKNKKRLVDMLENMRNPKIGTRKDIRKTIVPLAIGMESVTKKFLHEKERPGGIKRNENILLGPINENLWIARTGFQIWALSLSQLFQGSAAEETNSIERTRESLEKLVQIWLRDRDGMSLLHPVFDLG